jgi:hypothetical protein
MSKFTIPQLKDLLCWEYIGWICYSLLTTLHCLPLIMCTSQLNIATRLERWSRNEVHTVIQFLNIRHALVIEIRHQLTEVYDEGVMNQWSVGNWCVEFWGRELWSGKRRIARNVAAVHCLKVQSATTEGLQWLNCSMMCMYYCMECLSTSFRT